MFTEFSQVDPYVRPPGPGSLSPLLSAYAGRERLSATLGRKASRAIKEGRAFVAWNTMDKMDKLAEDGCAASCQAINLEARPQPLGVRSLERDGPGVYGPLAWFTPTLSLMPFGKVVYRLWKLSTRTRA
jgi:hypothetical protein